MKTFIKKLILLVLLACSSLAFSQSIPEFQFKIKITDAQSHSDTAVIGYDPLATYDLDPSFGETLITTPFDSLFEVRAQIRSGYAKKQIVQKDPTMCTVSGSWLGPAVIKVFIRAKSANFPLTLSYDHSLFASNSCHDSTLLDWYGWSEPYWGPYHLLRNYPSGNIIFSNHAMMGYQLINSYNSSGGVVLDTVYKWEFTMAGYDYYHQIVITGVQDHVQPRLEAKVYPNPAREEVQVSLVEPAWCYLTDVSGKIVEKVYLQAGNNPINVSHLSKGMYILRLQDKNNRQSIHKVLLIE